MFYTVNYTGGDFQLLEELRRIQEAFAFLARTALPTLHSPPEKPRDGFMAVADGVDWNPTGTGSLTPVIFLGGAWVDIANSGGSAGVVTFNGRSGAVAPQQGDYDTFFLTEVEADGSYSALGHGHSAGEITSGVFLDARIQESNVTQHQGALVITESQISDLNHNAAIDARVNKAFVDALNINADTLDGLDSTAFVTVDHLHNADDIDSESATSNTVLTADGIGGATWVPLPFTLPADPNADALLMWNNEVLTWEEEVGDWEVDNAAWGDLSEATEWVTTLANSFITVGNVTQHQGSIDHDALLNFVAAEHIDWSITGAENLHIDRLPAHDHTAADIDSEAAPDGFVLTADGAGGAAWEVPSGGSSLPGDPNVDAILFWDDVSGIAEWGTSIPNSFIPLSAVSQHVTKTFVDGLNVDADTLDGINGASFVRSDVDDTVAGVLTFTAEIQARRGINGNYSGTGGSATWGATIWSLDDSWAGPSASSSFAVEVDQYGLTWIRHSAANARAVTGEGLYIWRAGVECASIGITGAWFRQDVHAFSDIRVKDDLKVIPSALDKVNQLNGYTFTRRDAEDKQKRRAGVVAQEVERVLPEVVTTESDGMKSVAYGNMIALLIEAIKELNRKVDNALAT